MGSGKPKPAKERLLTIDFLFFQQSFPKKLLAHVGRIRKVSPCPHAPLPHFFLPHLKKRFTAPAPPSFWAQESAELDVTRREVLEEKGSWEKIYKRNQEI